MRRSGGVLVALVATLALALSSCGSDDQGGGPSADPSAQQTKKKQKKVRPKPPAPTKVYRPSLPPLTPAPYDGRPIPSYDEPVLGADMSWPQCPQGMGIPQKRSQGSPLPLPEAEYVVIGLTNGPGFYVNPCLPAMVTWAKNNDVWVSAYAVASFPEANAMQAYSQTGPFDGSTELGALKNVGYQQARFNVTSMLRTGFETPIVWIDVEPVPDFEWSADKRANAAVVEGIATGYREAGYRIGIYSTPTLWDGVVGDFELGVPEWRAAGDTSSAEALNRCGADWVIQGGEAFMGQWVEVGRDQNLTCPGQAVDLETWFYRY